MNNHQIEITFKDKSRIKTGECYLLEYFALEMMKKQ